MLRDAPAPTPSTRIIRWRLRFEARTEVHLPDYPGSTWRGAFGRALRSLSCLTGADHCNGCEHSVDCRYATIFDPSLLPPGHPDRVNHFTDPIRPFVIDFAWDHTQHIAAGEAHSLDISLFGPASAHGPSVIEAFTEAGARHRVGADRNQGKGILQLVDATPIPLPEQPPAPDETVQVLIETPLRIKANRRKHVLRPAQLTLAAIAQALIRRVPFLAPSGRYDRDRLIAETAETPLINPRLSWHTWRRYSIEKHQHQDHSGVIGAFTLPAPANHFPELWPLLWWGQYTHVGKGATFGLGAYRIGGEPVEAPSANLPVTRDTNEI
ncbi:MAG: CRISPR system precrRNA processing endoribonuclease RAMP protein Cas6 [Gammaproteobacteria bacterium]